MSSSVNSQDNKCSEMGIEYAFARGDVTCPFHFNFQTHLYGFVTCAGQIDEGISLGIVSIPLHWNVWIFIFFSALLLLAILSFGFGRFDWGWIGKMSISLILGSVGCEFAIRSELVRKKTLVGFSPLEFYRDHHWKFVSGSIKRVFNSSPGI